MSELAEIVRETSSLRARGLPFLLATVVRVEGSAYRRPGARMLVAEDRWLLGSVSGGCLERDVLVRGAFRTRNGAPAIVRYDGAEESDETAERLGIGCEGIVDVLLERIEPNAELDPMRIIEASFAKEATCALATVIGGTAPLGGRVAARDGEVVASTVAEPLAHAILARIVLEALAGERKRVDVVEEDGIVALVELFVPPPRLFVVGTRHDASDLTTLAKAAGYGVTVADAEVARPRFAAADDVFTGPPSALAKLVDERARPVVVIMTHDYSRDRAYLAALIETRARYVGVLGPRVRTQRMLQEMNVTLDDERRARLHAPVGLDLGAETPLEIALSILAEAQAALTGATMRPLRERTGPIHRRAEER